MTAEDADSGGGRRDLPSSRPGAIRVPDLESSTRILVVDDHDMFRRGLARLLSEGGVQVVGEASRASAALRLAGELHPDVVLMDLAMAGMGGGETMRAMLADSPAPAVVLLSADPGDEQAIGALLAGAAGCLSKGSSLEELLHAVAAAAAGGVVVPPLLGVELLRRLRDHQPDPSSSLRLELSVRELDILRLMVQGLDNGAIAAQLYISPNTVKNHVGRIVRKLGAANRLQASVQAVRMGMVP